jgi:catechol 2,3-dioxygenase-like lactoylglutathione lyase family enzyme
MKLECLDHVAISVRDVRRSVAWYREVLGLERLHEDAWGDAPAVVGAGGTGLALFAVEGPGSPPPGRDVLTLRHVAFRVGAAGFDAAQSELRERGVPFTFEDHGISRSVYVHDPDGHRIEVTTYEPPIS